MKEKIKRPKWLVIPEKRLTQKQIENLTDEWQHRLGLCDWGFKVIAIKDFTQSRIEFRSERYAVIYASDERRLLHELLHALFWRRNLMWRECVRELNPTIENFLKMNEQIIVFALTNALLRLKYGGG